MNSTQAALLAGGIIGVGVALIAYALIPARPDLRAYLNRLTVSPTTRTLPPASRSLIDRVGAAAMTRLPASWQTPTQQLDLIGQTTTRWWGEKITSAAVLALMPIVLAALLRAVGISPPLIAPLGVSLLLGVAGWFLPNLTLRQKAAAARREFSQSLAAFTDLVALERQGFAGPRQAMEQASAVGTNWAFGRISEELVRSRYNGVTPWDGLRRMGTDLDIPDLVGFADIMRTSGEDGAAIFETLRARSAAMRHEQSARAKSEAGAITVRLTFPVVMLAGIVIVTITAPFVLRLLSI